MLDRHKKLFAVDLTYGFGILSLTAYSQMRFYLFIECLRYARHYFQRLPVLTEFIMAQLHKVCTIHILILEMRKTRPETWPLVSARASSQAAYVFPRFATSPLGSLASTETQTPWLGLKAGHKHLTVISIPCSSGNSFAALFPAGSTMPGTMSCLKWALSK